MQMAVYIQANLRKNKKENILTNVYILLADMGII